MSDWVKGFCAGRSAAVLAIHAESLETPYDEQCSEDKAYSNGLNHAYDAVAQMPLPDPPKESDV